MAGKRSKRDPDEPKERRIIGVDGEGQDTPDGGHIYTYLAAVDDLGKLVAEAYNPKGLSHEECVAMLLSLPQEALKFGFMFSYDVTKIIEQMPTVDRYYLMRPQLRDETNCRDCKKVLSALSTICPECGSTDVHSHTRPLWYKGRQYGYFNGSLTIRHRKRKTKIWDCFRFFGCSFVEAIKAWKIGSPEQVARIFEMKQQRGSFEHVDPEKVKAYCREECHLLALMMVKLKKAHENAGIPLKRFDGAGSTATALLKANDVAEYKGTRHRDLDYDLGRAIASAFFGGRFEDSIVGIVEAPVHGYDISSAYPFAQTALPCLRCGGWRREKRATIDKIRKAALAVAAFRVKPASPARRSELAWCPLPCRDPKGSIAYGTNFTGWAWSQELVPALEGWPDLVELTGEAWIYDQNCEHQPFGYVPNAYRQRMLWGKEGAGIVMKLGINAGYGKTAQGIGEDPPFQSWPWAGVTTATTRGQILYAIIGARDPWDVLTVATDGIYSAEELALGPPLRDTGTGDLLKDGKPCPLGGWEHKDIPEGVFIVKPGLYYRLGAALADIRARGVGRREIHEARQRVEDGFRAWDRRDPKFHIAVESRRFYGAKHSIFSHSRCSRCKKTWPGVPEQLCPKCHQIGTDMKMQLSLNKDDGRPVYGRWGLRTVQIAFDPYPKREREGVSREGTFARLRVRDLEGLSSKPYDVGAAATTPEGMEAREAKEFMLAQPDWEDG